MYLSQEYFSSDDIGEVTRSLDELGHLELHYIFIKQLITLAMDRHGREKEMASTLISAVDAEVVSTDEIGKAFRLLLEQAEDLALDIPDAAYELALFLARAVVDDVLPPLYLTQVRHLFSCCFPLALCREGFGSPNEKACKSWNSSCHAVWWMTSDCAQFAVLQQFFSLDDECFHAASIVSFQGRNTRIREFLSESVLSLEMTSCCC